MDTQAFLSSLIHASKYARYVPELGRREVYQESVDRVEAMHREYYANIPEVAPYIDEAISMVRQQFVLPSMRCMQFAGLPILRNHARVYNCAFLAIDDVAAWWEVPFLLLSGCGVGYSVQHHAVDKLPKVRGTAHRRHRYVVPDTIEGWASAFLRLAKAHFYGWRTPLFDFRNIRPAGSELKTTGGKAPGPAKLKKALEQVAKVFRGARGRALTTLEVHDMMCHISDCVAAGGIRRSAMLTVFDLDDELMLRCKTGDWWVKNGQRSRANNSAAMLRETTTREDFDYVLKIARDSNAGEPAPFFTNNLLWGLNPCAEVALRSMQFCNLCVIAGGVIRTRAQFIAACRAAAILGTLQAGYTKFKGLRKQWQENCELEALLGISLTGQADNPGFFTDELLREGAELIVAVNKELAQIIGINQAARTTLGKPDGTSSLLVSCASGVHARHGRFYLRRIRFGRTESIVSFLRQHLSDRYIEDDAMDPNGVVVVVPVRSPEGSIVRSEETALDLARRAMSVNKNWIAPGHVSGDNKHNQSVTISVMPHEWDKLGDYLWEEREHYQGMAVLPYDGGTYTQLPHTEITEEEYLDWEAGFPEWVDFSEWIEDGDYTLRQQQVACAGGACEF